jgi:hypothetical protein
LNKGAEGEAVLVIGSIDHGACWANQGDLKNLFPQ